MEHHWPHIGSLTQNLLSLDKMLAIDLHSQVYLAEENAYTQQVELKAVKRPFGACSRGTYNALFTQHGIVARST